MRWKKVIAIAVIGLTLLAIALPLLGRGWHGQRTGMATAAEMKQHIEAEIPSGTSVDVATERLRAMHFDVSLKTGADWGGRDGIDYVYGDRREGGVVFRRWQVALFVEDDAVVDIDVSTGMVGP